MFIGFMIPRRPLGLLPQLAIIFAAASGLLTVSCEKVPLLAPTTASITLTASTTALPLNGTTDLIAQVLEQSGTPPHSGTHVIFTTTLGSVLPAEAETDVNGRAIVRFLAGNASGTATIVASSGGAGSSTTPSGGTGTPATTTTDSRTVKIAVGSAAVGRINLVANPGTVTANGGNSAIVANVGDVNGNVLANVPVTFTTDAGSLSAAVVNTDQNGNAQTLLTTNKTAKVTAAAGLTSGTGTAATGVAPATVTVNVNVGPTVTVGAPSPATPSVGQSVTFPLTYGADAASSPIQTVSVDFGDAGRATFTGKPTSVSHIYTAPGSYSVRVTATDTLGDSSTGSGSVLIAAKLQPTVSISTTTTNPTAGTDVAFTASVQPAAGSGTNIANVVVNFGDNTRTALGPVSGTNISIHHVYAGGGTYNVTLTATDTNGGVGTAATSVFVQCGHAVDRFTVCDCNACGSEHDGDVYGNGPRIGQRRCRQLPCGVFGSAHSA